MKSVLKSLDRLRPYAEQHDAILVAYSGGKDSIAVLDLCLRSFRRVEGFLMVIAPGIEYNARIVEDAMTRFGISVRTYPAPDCFHALRDGTYCNSPRSRDDWPDIKITDIYRLASHDTKIPLVADGARKQDSANRRHLLNRNRRPAWLLAPIADWLSYEVRAYLSLRQIPPPEQPGANARSHSSGLGLRHAALLWLHDTYPDDFARLLQLYPYAQAVISRRDFYPECYPGFPASPPAQPLRQVHHDDRAPVATPQRPVQPAHHE